MPAAQRMPRTADGTDRKGKYAAVHGCTEHLQNIYPEEKMSLPDIWEDFDKTPRYAPCPVSYSAHRYLTP